MARIIKTESKLKADYKKYRKYQFIFAGSAAVVLGVLAYCSYFHSRMVHTPAIIIPLAVMGILSAIAKAFGNRAQVLAAGLQGENLTETIFADLPDSYIVIPNVQLNTKDGVGEIDHLVLGDNGIFIVETKNYRGLLTGDVSDTELTKEKVSPGGIANIQQVKNPVRQVRRQTWLLKNVLIQAGIRKHIESVVCFINDDLQYDVTGTASDVEVFLASEDGIRQIRNYIMSSDKASLSEAEKNTVLKTLTGRSLASSSASPKKAGKKKKKGSGLFLKAAVSFAAGMAAGALVWFLIF